MEIKVTGKMRNRHGFVKLISSLKLPFRANREMPKAKKSQSQLLLPRINDNMEWRRVFLGGPNEPTGRPFFLHLIRFHVVIEDI